MHVARSSEMLSASPRDYHTAPGGSLSPGRAMTHAMLTDELNFWTLDIKHIARTLLHQEAEDQLCTVATVNNRALTSNHSRLSSYVVHDSLSRLRHRSRKSLETRKVHLHADVHD